MSWWLRRSTVDRVLAGALVTRRHFLKGAAILGVAVAVAPRVLVQVPESLVFGPRSDDDHATHLTAHITELSKLLKQVYGPSIAQQQALWVHLYQRGLVRL